MRNKKWFVNGGRGSGQTLRKIVEVYENKIAELEKENAELKEQLEKETAHRIGNFNKSIEWKERHRKLKQENAELKEKFLTVKKDDIRKAKLNDCKTYEEKVEYLRQVTNYALFNHDISVMLWCFHQRGEIDTYQLTNAKKIIKMFMSNYPRFTTEEMQLAEQFLKED